MCPGTAVGRLEVDIPVKHKVFLVTYFYYVREVAAMFEEMRHYIFESSEKIRVGIKKPTQKNPPKKTQKNPPKKTH
jgi:hypothetical protein